MNQIEKYFNAEKYESVLFVLVGIVAIALAAYFFIKVKQPFYNGMAYSIIAFALIQIVVGSTVWIRSPKDIERVSQIVKTEKSKIQTEEILRMEIVMKKFDTYRWVEIALLLVGGFMFLYFIQDTFLEGIGLGLAIQSAFMLFLDFFAESRGKVYLEYLQKII
jgi:hypothetical protein